MNSKYFEKLAEELSGEEKILQSRINAENLKELHDRRLTKVKDEGGKIVAFFALWPTSDKRWFELGSIWVHPEWRAKRVCSRFFARCLRDHHDKNIFLITRSEAIIHLATKYNMTEEPSPWTDNPFWRKLCRPWDSLDVPSGPTVPKEGRLFFKYRPDT